MRLRVLDDVRPGYAQLAFDGPLTQPALALSVRSQHESAYLGPDGSWLKFPHYFTATRLDGDARSSLYRVGPEIVNYLRELDTIELATEDGALHVETTWENAVPQMPKSGKPGHTIYGRPSQRLDEEQRAETPVEPVEDERRFEEATTPEKISEAQPTEDTESPRAADPEPRVTIETDPPASVTPRPRLHKATPKPEPRSNAVLFIVLGVLALAALGFAAYKFLPCAWLPQDYCPVDQAEIDARQKARVCIFYKSQGGLDCEVQKDCVDPYVSAYPNGPSRTELDSKAKTSNDICKQMAESAETALTCIGDLKRLHRSRCDVQVACTQNFQSLYPLGPLRRKIDHAAEEAQVDCECERHPSSCDHTTNPESQTLAGDEEEQKAWTSASACANDTSRKCAAPGCYTSYLDQFGSSGAHKDEAQNAAGALAASCARSDEAAAFQGAQDCARGPQRCAAQCYASYLSKYGSSGQNSASARADSQRIENECTATSAQQADDAAWQAAKRCASGAAVCGIASCYQNTYLARFGSTGTHRYEATQEIARAEDACGKSTTQTSIADGRYWARSRAACGNRTDFSINVDVKGNHVSWEQDFLGNRYQWEGTIDSSGNVTARANGNGATASGRFVDDGEKTIQMKYPQCTTEPVTLEIRGKYQ